MARLIQWCLEVFGGRKRVDIGNRFCLVVQNEWETSRRHSVDKDGRSREKGGSIF